LQYFSIKSAPGCKVKVRFFQTAKLLASLLNFSLYIKLDIFFIKNTSNIVRKKATLNEDITKIVVQQKGI